MKKACLLTVVYYFVMFTLSSTPDRGVQASELELGAEERKRLEDICKTNPRACKIRSRLWAFEPNYVIWQSTDNDDDALEAHYSFRYMLTRPHCRPGNDLISDFSLEKSIKCIEKYSSRTEVFLAYTGEFDFYLSTRDSGPVINRISNPGIYVRKHFPDSAIEWLELSAQHRSNGQVTEIDETDGSRLKTQIAFENDDLEYFDGISRGANYFALQTRIDLGWRSKLWVNLKAYESEDSKVNWGPDAADDPSIEDYDRLRLIYSKAWGFRGKTLEASAEWVIGDEGLDTDSFDIDLLYPAKYGKIAVPWYIRIHSGPMNTLSNYTLEQDTIGIGVKLKI